MFEYYDIFNCEAHLGNLKRGITKEMQLQVNSVCDFECGIRKTLMDGSVFKLPHHEFNINNKEIIFHLNSCSIKSYSELNGNSMSRSAPRHCWQVKEFQSIYILSQEE